MHLKSDSLTEEELLFLPSLGPSNEGGFLEDRF